MRHAADIHGAIHTSLARAEHPEEIKFNLPLQIVPLLFPLRTLGDDRSVAECANRLMRLPEVRFNALRELAAELGAAEGPETLAALRHLASLGRNDEIEPYLSRAFERRGIPL